MLIFGHSAKENWYSSPEGGGMRKQRLQSLREQLERARGRGCKGQDQNQRAGKMELPGPGSGVRKDAQGQDSGGEDAYPPQTDTPTGRTGPVMGHVVELIWRRGGLSLQ